MMIPVRPLLSSGLLALAAAAPAQAAQTEQRTCHFDYTIRPDGQRAEADWTVVIASRDGAASIRVDGSGDYVGMARSFDSAASEITFRTPVSTETITIGPGGETIWQIDFDDGATMAYFGTCKQPRVTS